MALRTPAIGRNFLTSIDRIASATGLTRTVSPANCRGCPTLPLAGSLELVRRAHHAIIAGCTHERRIRQNVIIAILPCERHIPPDVVSEDRVEDPGIIKSGTADVFDTSVRQLAI